MTNDVKAYILYEYIVGNQPTTNGKLIQSVCSKYGVRGMSDTDYEMVFREYNINYDDIARGKKGGRGQHLGKYKNGYRNNKGKVCSVTLDVIKEYMNSYKRTQKNLEEFLYEKFFEKEPPKQTSYKPPVREQSAPKQTYSQQTYYKPPVTSQPVYSEPAAHSQPRTQVSYNTGTYIDFSELLPKIISVVIVVALIIVGYNMITNPSGNIFSGLFGGSNENSSQILSNKTCTVDVMISFEGESYQMWFKEGYVFHIGNNLESELSIGYLNSFHATLNEGYYDFWVQSGNTKSKVYRVLVQGDGRIDFDCGVGIFGPKFSDTVILGEVYFQ